MPFLKHLLALVLISILAACGGGGGSSGATPNDEPLFTTAPSNVTLPPLGSASYTVGGGVAPYTITSNNTSVVRVTQSGSSYTLTPVAIGTAQVQIRDSDGGAVSIAVAVANDAMSLNPDTANTLIGLVNYARIVGGTPPYTVVSGFPSAVTAQIGVLVGTTFTATSNGNVLRMVANQAVDPAQVIVTDSTGNSVNFELTAEPGSPAFTFAPTSLTLAEGYDGTVTLLLYGATPGDVNLFSTLPSIASVPAKVTAVGSQVTEVILTLSGSTICASGEVLITAVDSVGATALATIAIEDDVSNNAVCEVE